VRGLGGGWFNGVGYDDLNFTHQEEYVYGINPPLGGKGVNGVRTPGAAWSSAYMRYRCGAVIDTSSNGTYVMEQ